MPSRIARCRVARSPMRRRDTRLLGYRGSRGDRKRNQTRCAMRDAGCGRFRRISHLVSRIPHLPTRPAGLEPKRVWLGPDSGNPAAAGGTTTVTGDALLFDHVAMAFDQQIAAIRTVRVLPTSHTAGKIARVHEPE